MTAHNSATGAQTAPPAPRLRLITPEQAGRDRHDPVDSATLETARMIIDDVREHGRDAFERRVQEFGDRFPAQPALYDRDALEAATLAVSSSTRAHLESMVGRVRAFALHQRASIIDLDTAVPGGRAGHKVFPVERAGCYAPGGRFPLPSSVVMTAATARAAGVHDVTVVSPRATPETLAAAGLCGADRLLVAGGAHAIAALAYGVEGLVDPVDVIVGPGNRWVTAAKLLVSGRVRIDMLAGPSELLIIADNTADPAVVAADLLAQAEHDTDAIASLITLDPALPARVDAELAELISTLPTAETARTSLANGWACLVATEEDAAELSDRVAPEHLQLLCTPELSARLTDRLSRYGGLFIGHGTAEVFGDYGAGPNHTLPTGGTARYTGGLSVLDFLAVRTWLRTERPSELIETSAAVARMEGLEAHARAAEQRWSRR